MSTFLGQALDWGINLKLRNGNVSDWNKINININVTCQNPYTLEGLQINISSCKGNVITK